ncbi:hypothetical protein B0H13DRAFT_2413156 [Mycena leptocephala]|nr:hypothetical protein B0H13DRAFT_2413156 [Mycena leptocephala]
MLLLEGWTLILKFKDTRRLLIEKSPSVLKFQSLLVKTARQMNGGQAQGKWSCVELLYLSPLQGPARVGIADEEDPEFTKFFGTIMEHEYLDSPELSSQLLLIPRNDRLKLTIASIGVRAFFKRSAFLVAHHDVGHQISAWPWGALDFPLLIENANSTWIARAELLFAFTGAIWVQSKERFGFGR